MYMVSLLRMYMSRPTKVHYSAAKRILRYLQGTTKFGILYKKEGNCELIGFTDSDYVGSAEDRRSTSGYVFYAKWSCSTLVLSKATDSNVEHDEAEFVAAAGSSC